MCLIVAVTWSVEKDNLLSQQFPLNLEECTINCGIITLPANPQLYFPRELKNQTSRKQEEETFNYLDFAILSIAKKDFQHVLLSMTFDSTFYSLLSGQSKKVHFLYQGR